MLSFSFDRQENLNNGIFLNRWGRIVVFIEGGLEGATYYVKRIPVVLITVVMFFFNSISVLANTSGSSDYFYENGLLKRIYLSDSEMVEYQYDSNGNVISSSVSDSLLLNPDFESLNVNNGVGEYWNRWASSGIVPSYEIVKTPISSGKQAQKISATAINGSVNIYQDIAVKPGTDYTINGRVQIPQLNNVRVLYALHFFDANGTLLGGATPFSYAHTTGWVNAGGEITTPPNAIKARLHLQLESTGSNASGTVYFDSMSFKKTTDSNMLSNGEFETYTGVISGVGDHWNRWASSGIVPSYEIVKTPVSSGKQAQKISAAAINGSVNVYQDIAVKPGTDYAINGRMQVPQLNNARVSYVIHYFDSSNSYIGGTTPFSYNYTTGWVSASGEITTPPNAVKARLHLQLESTGNNASGTVYFDSISFKKTTDSNLLINGEFEIHTGVISGVGDHWNRWASSGVVPSYEIVKTPISSGKQAQKISAAAINGSVNVYQDITVRPNMDYAINGRIQIPQLNNARVIYAVHYFDGNGILIGGATPFSYTHTTGWVNATGEIKTPPNATKARLHLHLESTGSNASGTVYFDSISMRLKNN